MNTSLNHGSARIYQFPAGGRAALGGRRYDESQNRHRAWLRRGSTKLPAAAAWYHEAAIQESKPGRER